MSIGTTDHCVHQGRRLCPAQLAFKVGTRVRLSELGRHRFQRLSYVSATVVGYSRYGSALNVVFDGNKSSTLLHASYLVAEQD